MSSRRRRALAFAMVLAGAACSRARDAAVMKAVPVPVHVMADPALLQMLAPDLSLESATLQEGADGAVTYVAHLREAAPLGYADAYRARLRSRGFFMRPFGTSPHAPIQLIRGYEFFALRRGADGHHSLLMREFADGRTWLERPSLRESLTDFPDPLHVGARVITLKLGQPRSRLWQETELLPEHDVVRMRELPFPRAPNAILVHAHGLETEESASARLFANRVYVVRGATMDSVVDHYQQVLSRLGIQATREENRLRWSGAHPPVQGIEYISLEPSNLAPAPGSGLEWSDLQRFTPDLLRDFPADVVTYQLIVRFERLEAAAPFTSDLDRAGKIGVLDCGFHDEARRLVAALGHAPVAISHNADFPGLRAILLPIAGLSGQNDAVRKRLASFVASGGTVIALSQALDSDLAALPAPPGDAVRGWGFKQDNDDDAGSTYVAGWHPILASITTARVSAYIDGHFESLPHGASVLLRRARDGAPALAVYPYGKGQVVLTSAYEGADGKTAADALRGVLRDALTWALHPSAAAAHAPGEKVALPVRLENNAHAPAAHARLVLRAPGRGRVLAEATREIHLAAGAVTHLDFSYDVPADAPLGLYTIDAEITDGNGQALDETGAPGALLAVGRPPHEEVEPPPLSISLVAPHGEDAVVGRPVTFAYALVNRSAAPRHLRLYQQWAGAPPILAGEINVAGEGRQEGTFALPPQAGRKGLWVHVYEDGGQEHPRPPFHSAILPKDTGAYQTSDYKGLFLKASP